MPNRSGIWDLRQVGVNEAAQLWKTVYLTQRAVFMGGAGYAAGSTDAGTNVDYRDDIDFVTITTDGDASDFGDLTVGKHHNSSAASSTTRTVNMGGTLVDSPYPLIKNVIDYITLATTGDASDFGDLTAAVDRNAGVSDSTRAVNGGGYTAAGAFANTMDYITIATTGNATDFGDRTEAKYMIGGNIQSTTRGCYYGGDGAGDDDAIDFITIQTTGNATDFGDLTGQVDHCAGCSSPTRGVRSGGWYPGGGSAVNTMDYITIASAGDATDFGDLRTVLRAHTSTGSHTKGLIAGGNSHAANAEIQKITIASTGNATDFGDMVVGRYATQSGGAASGAHGGIG